jgi:NACHT domain
MRRRRWAPDKRGVVQALVGLIAAVINTALPVGAVLDVIMAIGNFEESDLDAWHARLIEGVERWAVAHPELVESAGGLRTGWDEEFLTELDKMGASALPGSDRCTRLALEEALARTAFMPLVSTEPAWQAARAAARCLAGDLPELLVEAAGAQSGLAGLLQVLRSDLAEILARLPPGPADRAVCNAYLKVVAHELDHDPWTRMAGGRDSSLTLIAGRLRAAAGPDTGYRSEGGYAETADAVKLAARCERIVLLGGPGAGKTWLARRIAIGAAQRAGEQLTAGADLATVEIPLFARCQAVLASGLPAWKAVVEAALAQVGHRFGSDRLAEALRRRFLDQSGRFLVVLDGLDEADHLPYGDFLDRLAKTAGLDLRIVLTSRPDTWRHQLPLDTTNERHRVAVLQSLAYPEDVTAVTGAWLAGNPDARDELIARLAGNAELAQAAGTPLLCAMYCLLAETGDIGELAGARLTGHVITRLLHGTWRGRHLNAQGQAAARAALRRLAWPGVGNDPVTGLAAWPELVRCVFEPQLSQDVEAAVSHVAPQVPYSPDNGNIARQFLHPLIREHLVAEYVAALPAVDEARDAIRPHLWRDPQWRQVLPWAIAAHPSHDALLDELVCGETSSRDLQHALERRDGLDELRGLLLQLAAETSPGHWSSGHAALIDQACCSARAFRNWHRVSRIPVAARGWLGAQPDPSELAQLARGAIPWPQLKIRAWAGEISLPEADRHRAIQDLADFLCGRRMHRRATHDGRSRIRLEVPDEDHYASVATLLDALGPGPGEREAVIHGLTRQLEKAAHPWNARALRVLTGQPAPDSLLRAVLGQLPTAPQGTGDYRMSDHQVRDRAVALDLLGASEALRQDAVILILAYLSRIPPGETLLHKVTEAIICLQPEPVLRVLALDQLLHRLYGIDSWHVRELMDDIRALLPSPKQAGSLLTELVRHAGPWRMTQEAGEILSQLSADAPEDDRNTAVGVAADRLMDCGYGEDIYLWALHVNAMDPTDVEREAASQRIVDRLAGTPADSCGYPMMAARELRPTPGQRHELLGYLLRQIRVAVSEGLRVSLCRMAAWFSPPGAARQEVAAALLDASQTTPLPFHHRVAIESAIETLPFTSEEREELIDQLISKLPSGNSYEAEMLAWLIIAAGPTSKQRVITADALVARLNETAHSRQEKQLLLQVLHDLQTGRDSR